MSLGVQELEKIESVHQRAQAAAQDAAAAGQELAWTLDPLMGPGGYPVRPGPFDSPPFDTWDGWCRMALDIAPGCVISAGDSRWNEPKHPALEWPENMWNNMYQDHYSIVPKGFTLRVWDPKSK